MNDDDNNSRMSIVSNDSETEMASTNFGINSSFAASIEKTSLEEEYNKRAYLDGTWFTPDLSKSSSTGKVYGICQLCKVEFNKHSVICGSLNSSPNFKTHLKGVHSQKLTEFENYCLTKRQRLHNSQDNKPRRTYCDFSQKEFEDNVTNFILDSFVPYNTVDLPAFRKIFDDMNIRKNGKQLHHLSARTLLRRIEESYNNKMKSIKHEILNTKHVCTTADIWSSHSRRFIGVTVHWIDAQSVKRISYAIACKRFSGSHTHDRIANILNEIHSNYEITSEKLIATVTDNGSNFVKAFQNFGVHLDDSLFYEGESIKNFCIYTYMQTIKTLIDRYSNRILKKGYERINFLRFIILRSKMVKRLEVKPKRSLFMKI
ncbi:hypothetical protein DMN91_010819 [Ooceraea biroi]|uniref:BED-type domain-containing protein n=1 Tax=Ooceraea biroi TaxID=2015173 RepID=A0A3L8D8W7_OOCBI|nr:hypothetical protein DMN91_010819 [Ooceraea biroi]